MEQDLNLLRVLAAVAEHRKVAAAARALGMTQPGVSNALRRLRSAYDDPIFVRTPQGMRPSPRAEPLIEAARDILDIYKRRMLGQPAFVPHTARTEFRLAMSDVGEMALLPRLLQHLRRHAPYSTVKTVTLTHTSLACAMEEGSVDLAIGYFPDLKGTSFFQQKLFSHGFVCLVRADHPQVGSRLSRKQFTELEHAAVHAQGRSQEVFERYLRRRGITRRVVLDVPHFMSIPMVIAKSDLVVTVPLAVASTFAAIAKLKLVNPAFGLPRFDVKQHWHRRVHRDSRGRWLRAQFASVFTEETDEWSAANAHHS